MEFLTNQSVTKAINIAIIAMTKDMNEIYPSRTVWRETVSGLGRSTDQRKDIADREYYGNRCDILAEHSLHGGRFL